MNLSSTSAVVIVLFVTFLWGSWFQTVKHTGTYPITAFISWMYLFSAVIVWSAVFLLPDEMIPSGIQAEITARPLLILLIFICGMVFAVAMQLHLTVVGRIGLILSTSVSATCCILCGTIVSAVFGGIPEEASFLSIFAASLLLVLATVTCQYAGVKRDREQGNTGSKAKESRRHDLLLLIFINAVLMSAYPLATSAGIRSPLNPNGVSSLTCMAVLAAGALAGSNAFTVITVSRRKQWHLFWHPDTGIARILLMALIAAFCHFGGNILHAIAAPVISVAIATAMGNSYHVWSYLWGLLYGEFKGVSRRVYLVLGAGILLFLAGVLLLKN